MSVVSTAQATWSGTLKDGSGSTSLISSGLGTFATNWKARAEGADGNTTPEELLGAAHAACYSMAMSHGLAEQGLVATRIDVKADVTFVPGDGITGVALTVVAEIPGMEQADFAAFAEAVKGDCPVSKALTGTTVTLTSAALL
jgi:osmotically inducible protein OsmC